MSKIGQIRLAKEFANLQALQQDPRIDGIVNIEYNPVESGDRDEWVSIMVRPKSGLYPHRFKFEYHMPMYVGPGRLERRWHAAFVLDAPEHILMDPHSNNNVFLFLMYINSPSTLTRHSAKISRRLSSIFSRHSRPH